MSEGARLILCCALTLMMTFNIHVACLGSKLQSKKGARKLWEGSSMS
jgi:hypothetical protein